ncbi:MAG: hypothetical protein L0I24_20875 [Pseudonocardia sp.]|nr:hypothetical protein [Pseudonocardia sp.]
MRVRLIRRWGPTQAGESVDVDPVQGRWLIDHAFGTATGEPAPKQEAAAPGEHGSDPLASGDGTRQGTPAMVKGERRDNNAAPLPGSPEDEARAARESERDGQDAPDVGAPTASGGQAKARRTTRRRASS